MEQWCVRLKIKILILSSLTELAVKGNHSNRFLCLLPGMYVALQSKTLNKYLGHLISHWEDLELTEDLQPNALKTATFEVIILLCWRCCCSLLGMD